MKEDIKNILWLIGSVLIIYAIFYGGMMFQKYMGEPRIVTKIIKSCDTVMDLNKLCINVFGQQAEKECYKHWEQGYKEGYDQGRGDKLVSN